MGHMPLLLLKNGIKATKETQSTDPNQRKSTVGLIVSSDS